MLQVVGFQEVDDQRIVFPLVSRLGSAAQSQDRVTGQRTLQLIPHAAPSRLHELFLCAEQPIEVDASDIKYVGEVEFCCHEPQPSRVLGSDGDTGRGRQQIPVHVQAVGGVG